MTCHGIYPHNAPHRSFCSWSQPDLLLAEGHFLPWSQVRLHLHVIIVVVVHDAGHVQEGFDAVDVGADGSEVSVFADAGLGTEMAQEVLAVHLLTVDTAPQTPGVGGPRGRGGRQGEEDQQGEQQGLGHSEPM